MRFAALLLAVSPSFVFADTIVARIAPTDVTVFTQGAEVTRMGQIDLPAGIHEIAIPDMRPNNGGTDTPTVTLSGATLISEKWQNNNSVAQLEPETEEYAVAKAAVETIQDAVTELEDEISKKQLAITAANAQLEFLKSLSDSDTLPDGIDTLRDLSRMISDETLSANVTIQNAENAVRNLRENLPNLQDSVAMAQRMLNALLPPTDRFAQLTLTVSVPAATNSDISIKYLVRDAAWRPVYDMRLTTGDDPKLVVERGALLLQQSGERWNDVNLTLSTVGLKERPEPSRIFPQPMRISDPDLMVKRQLNSRVQSSYAETDMVLEAPAIIEEASGGVADLSGIAAQYNFEYAMSLDSSGDFTRVTLGALDFNAEIEARAVPLNNPTAYRMVTFTNSSSERILPAEASLYVDGRLIADSYVNQIVPGAETELGFGPIHGLRLTRTTLDRNESDRGIITRSNENTETVRIDVENLTGEDWNVTLLDRVPYAEQEDLIIDWSAAPRPTTTDYEDMRGVLHWDLDIKSGTTQSVNLKTKITWPEGMVLR
ncbi:MAG: DUF4139 domain-containing protein [Ascidiaceihabitans sp.]|nr:DUF4139 domain-containing protein [Ascidiaceihabitans sp.]